MSSAMKDVCEVDFQTRQSQVLTSSPENLSGPLGSRQGPLVLTQQGKGLDRSTQCASHFRQLSCLLEESHSPFQQPDRAFALAIDPQDIPFRPKRSG